MAQPTIIGNILEGVRLEIDEARRQEPLAELKKRVNDAPPVRSLAAVLRQDPRPGLIAEIKRHAPSRGKMREENVREAPRAYQESPMVRALSILTNRSHFEMAPSELTRIRAMVDKPVLRKEFIIDEYQVYQTRALGADALLLMANVLEPTRLKDFFDLSRELGLEVLFETHSSRQIDALPENAEVVGINSRTFEGRTILGLDRYSWSRLVRRLGLSRRDLSVRLEQFSLIEHLQPRMVKVAESGVTPETMPELGRLGFDAALVGNSLLLAEAGIREMLAKFERAMEASSASLQ